MLRERVASVVIHKLKIFCKAQKGICIILALQCCAGLVSSGFPCKVA